MEYSSTSFSLSIMFWLSVNRCKLDAIVNFSSNSSSKYSTSRFISYITAWNKHISAWYESGSCPVGYPYYDSILPPVLSVKAKPNDPLNLTILSSVAVIDCFPSSIK